MDNQTTNVNKKPFWSFTAKDLTRTALGVALITVCAWLKITFIPNMPFTMQVLGVAFCAYYLGIRNGLLAVIAYLLLGLVGAPVFNGGAGGAQMFVGYTGGFLVGFLPMALVISLIDYFGKGKLLFKIIGAVAGHLALYVVGNVWFVFVQGFADFGEFMDKIRAVIVMMLPFFAIDIVKFVLAILLDALLKRVNN